MYTTRFLQNQIRNPALAIIHREGYLQGRDGLEILIANTLTDAGRTATPGELRAFSIAVNGIVDGLWLEASMAADLFSDGELGRVALVAVERIIGISLAE